MISIQKIKGQRHKALGDWLAVSALRVFLTFLSPNFQFLDDGDNSDSISKEVSVTTHY